MVRYRQEPLPQFGQWWLDDRQWSKPLTQSAVGWVAAIGILSLPAVATRLPVSSVPVFGYGFMLLVGFTIALSFARRQAKLAGLEAQGIMATRVAHRLPANPHNAHYLDVKKTKSGHLD